MTDPALGAEQSSAGPLTAVESMPWASRQWLSVAVSVVLAPLGLACVMSGGYLHYTEAAMRLGSSPLGVGLVILGALLLLAVAAAARVAGIGPVLVGAVCALLGVIAMFSQHLVWDVTNLFGIRSLQIGTFSYATVLLPSVGTLLVGAGLAGRWQRGSTTQDAAGGAIVEL